MKLKQATLCAIIGMVIQIINTTLWTLVNFDIVGYNVIAPYSRYVNLIGFIGYILVLPFFITLYKSQK